MLTETEKRKIYAEVDAQCDRFEIVVQEIIEAGLYGPRLSGALLFDNDGNWWHKFPNQMGPADIREYVEHCFPAIFVTFLRNMPVMTIH